CAAIPSRPRSSEWPPAAATGVLYTILPSLITCMAITCMAIWQSYTLGARHETRGIHKGQYRTHLRRMGTLRRDLAAGGRIQLLGAQGLYSRTADRDCRGYGRRPDRE